MARGENLPKETSLLVGFFQDRTRNGASPVFCSHATPPASCPPASWCLPAFRIKRNTHHALRDSLSGFPEWRFVAFCHASYIHETLQPVKHQGEKVRVAWQANSDETHR